MNLFELVEKNLETNIELTEDELLTEGMPIILMSPMTAFMTLKRGALNILANNPVANVAKKVGQAGKRLAVTPAIEMEKLKATAGAKSGKGNNATIYKLMPQQIKFLSELQEKYGDEIPEAVLKFRTSVLAPYQIIKRSVASNKMLTSAEINGMTKDEYMKYRESGRKKIERRGTFVGDFETKRKDLSASKEAIREAKKILDDFKNRRTIDISDRSLEKVFKLAKIGTTDLQGYSLDEMRHAVNRIKTLEAELEKTKRASYDPTDAKEAFEHAESLYRIYRQMVETKSHGRSKIYTGDRPDKDKKEDKKTQADPRKVHHGSFEIALRNYLLRAEVRREMLGGVDKNGVRTPGKFDKSIYGKFYVKILKDQIEDLGKQDTEKFGQMVNVRKDIEFNEYEKKIWAPLPSNMQKYSGNVADYYQKIKEEDFKEPKYYNLQANPKLQAAENAINKEIKRFERRMKEIVTPEEFKELKRLRLISANLITFRELKSPGTLFKSKDDFEDFEDNGKIDDENKLMKDEPKDKVDGYDADTKDYISEDEYVRKLHVYMRMKFNSFAELEKAKKKIAEYEENAKDDLAEKYKNLTSQFMRRRDLEPSEFIGGSIDNLDTPVGIDDIERMMEKMINKSYTGYEQLRHDQESLEDITSSFKKQHKNADDELDKISDLKKQLERKIERPKM
jgi:hypothetical protein